MHNGFFISAGVYEADLKMELFLSIIQKAFIAHLSQQ